MELDTRWNDLSDTDKASLTKNPLKAYGSTFIAVVNFGEGCFVLKLGDGNVNLLYGDGTILSPSELQDDQLQFNMTTSLCSSSAATDFKHCFRIEEEKKHKLFRRKPRGLIGAILSTDGVINCYSKEEAYLSFIKNVKEAYLDDPKEKAHRELEECLYVLSEKGSGDDLSLTVLLKRN